jgi:hypothetical protein
LEKRLQYVRIGSHVSDVRELNAGAPQGTIAGPNDFKVLINDLHFELPYIKYVDDTTVASVSRDPDNPALQDAADQCKDNIFSCNRVTVAEYGSLQAMCMAPRTTPLSYYRTRDLRMAIEPKASSRLKRNVSQLVNSARSQRCQKWL